MAVICHGKMAGRDFMIMPYPSNGVDKLDAVDKRDLIASVAYALWEDRKRHNLPDDPDADWFQAEELISNLWKNRPQSDTDAA